MPKFKHIAKGQYHTKIKVLVPGDFDQLDEQEITFTLRRYKVDEGRAILQRFRDSGTVGDDTDVVAGILRESVLDWSGVPAADGGEVPFSGDALAELINEPAYRRALFNRVLADLRGPDEAARKN